MFLPGPGHPSADSGASLTTGLPTIEVPPGARRGNRDRRAPRSHRHIPSPPAAARAAAPPGTGREGSARRAEGASNTHCSQHLMHLCLFHVGVFKDSDCMQTRASVRPALSEPTRVSTSRGDSERPF